MKQKNREIEVYHVFIKLGGGFWVCCPIVLICFIDRSLVIYYWGIGSMYNPDMPFLGQRPLAGKLGAVVTTVAGSGHERTLETLTFCMEKTTTFTWLLKLPRWWA